MIENLKDLSEQKIILSNIEKIITDEDFNVVRTDFDKPWGVYFAQDNSDSYKYSQLYLMLDYSI